MTRPSSRWTSEDERPLPEPAFIRQVLGDLWESLFALVVWALVLGILCIPVFFASVLGIPFAIIVATFTLAPGLAGMMVMAGKAARGGFARLGDSVRGTVRLYWRSVALTLPLALCLLVILATGNVVRSYPQRHEMTIAWALQMGIGLTMVILHLYLFPVLALYDARLKLAVRLAATLAGKFVWQTLALLAFGAALLAAPLLHPLIWLFVPGVWCVIVMNATWRMSRRVLPEPSGIDK